VPTDGLAAADLVFATSLGAESSHIVSGGRDVLALGSFSDSRILDAADALVAFGR